MLEQSNVADDTREFLQRWGLKGKFVAATCYIPERIFSRFLNHKTALILICIKNKIISIPVR